MKKTLVGLTAILSLTIALVGCGGGSSDSSSEKGASASGEENAQGENQLPAEVPQAESSKSENMLPNSFTGYWVDDLLNCDGQLGLGIFASDGKVDISGYHSYSKDVQVKYNGDYYSLYYTNVYEEPDLVEVSKEELHMKMTRDGKLIIINLKTREETILVKC